MHINENHHFDDKGRGGAEFTAVVFSGAGFLKNEGGWKRIISGAAGI
jgi:hypothetical protein